MKTAPRRPFRTNLYVKVPKRKLKHISHTYLKTSPKMEGGKGGKGKGKGGKKGDKGKGKGKSKGKGGKKGDKGKSTITVMVDRSITFSYIGLYTNWINNYPPYKPIKVICQQLNSRFQSIVEISKCKREREEIGAFV